MIEIFLIDKAYKWTCRERVLFAVSGVLMSIPFAAQPGFGSIGLRRVVILIPINNQRNGTSLFLPATLH